MKTSRLGNLQAGRLRQHSLVVGAGTLLLFSLIGASARPRVSRHAAEAALAEARLRSGQYEELAAARARFQAAGGTTRYERALAALRGVVPGPKSELDVYGFFRLQSRQAGIELEALAIEESCDAGLARLDDVIALRAVRLSGRSPLGAVLALLAAVRRTGQPVSVEEFHLLGRDPGGILRWSLELALLESHPPSAFQDLGAVTPTEMP